MPYLICEGPSCNPGLAEYDEGIVIPQPERRGIPLHPEIAQRLRSWRYTPHDQISGVEARCTVCGHRRRYGAV